MRTYQLKMLGTMRARVEIEHGDIRNLLVRIKRGEWLKDIDGERLNPAHISAVKLVRS